MTKTPKILQIAIISVAILVAGFIGFSLIFGPAQEDISKFLSSKDAIKKFKAQNGKRQAGTDKISPLVNEARKFADYLDPPPPPMPVQPNINNFQAVQKQISVKPVIPIVKFDLLATIVNKSKPEESRAMIDLPGEGKKFVKPGQQVGHTTIEQIKDGSVIVKAGERTEEVAAKIEPLPSLVKDSPNHIFKLFPDLKTDGQRLTVQTSQPGIVSNPATTPSVYNPAMSRFSNAARNAALNSPSVGNSTSISVNQPGSTSRTLTRPVPLNPAAQAVRRTSRTAPPRLSPEQEKKAMEALMAELSQMKSKGGSNAAADMQKIMKAMKAENNASANPAATPAENTAGKPE